MLSALLLCVDHRGVRGEGDEGGGRDWRKAVKRAWRASFAIRNTFEGGIFLQIYFALNIPIDPSV